MKRLDLGDQDSNHCQEFLTRLAAVGIDVTALDLSACAKAHETKLMPEPEHLPLRHRVRFYDDVADSLDRIRFTNRHT